jgi:transposase InsO family protein
MHDHKRIWRIYNQELVDRGRPSRYLSTALVRQREDLRIMNKSKVGKPYHPRGRGKIERYHKTLYRELICTKEFTSLSEFKRELWKFDKWYIWIR